MTKCPACGSTNLHRSRSASLGERARKMFSAERPHRCHACGWRGWGIASPHPHAASESAGGWETLDFDLSDLDGADARRRAQREQAMSAVPAPGGSHRRHRHRASAGSSARVGSSEFNRRMQLVLFVALLLLGVVVVFRACSSGGRPVAPEPVGQAFRIED